MSKTLLLLRHAKSSWKEQGQPDFDRPLNDRGKRDALRVGRVLQEHFLRPDVILSSSAKRAMKTTNKLIRSSGYEVRIEFLDELYLADPDTYLANLNRLDDDVNCAMVVGHNPGLEELFATLTGYHEHLPTAALVHLEVNIDSWSNLRSKESAQVIWFWRPKDEE